MHNPQHYSIIEQLRSNYLLRKQLTDYIRFYLQIDTHDFMQANKVYQMPSLQKFQIFTFILHRIFEAEYCLQLIIHERKLLIPFLLRQTQQIFPLLLLKPYLRVRNNWQDRFLALNLKIVISTYFFIFILILTLQYLLIDRIESQQSIIQSMLFPLKRHLPEHSYLHLTLHLLLLYLTPLFLQKQLLLQFLLQRIHPPQKIRDQFIDDINLIENYVVEFDCLIQLLLWMETQRFIELFAQQ